MPSFALRAASKSHDMPVLAGLSSGKVAIPLGRAIRACLHWQLSQVWEGARRAGPGALPALPAA